MFSHLGALRDAAGLIGRRRLEGLLGFSRATVALGLSRKQYGDEEDFAPNPIACRVHHPVGTPCGQW